MSILFPLKLRLSTTSLGGRLIGERRITSTDAKISRRMRKYEYDYEAVKQTRQNNRNEVLKLQRALNRVDQRDLGAYEKRTMADIRRYENALRRQAGDIMKVITQLKRLIENEDLEILYDIRNPLATFEEFVKNSKHVMKGMHLDKPVANEVEKIIEGIEKEFDSLIDHTIQFIENEFKYLTRVWYKAKL